MEIKPIPYELLVHSAVVKGKESSDVWGLFTLDDSRMYQSSYGIGNFSYSEGMSRGGAVIENPQFSNQVFEYLSAGGFLGGAVMTYGD